MRSKVGGDAGGLNPQTVGSRRTCVQSWLADRMFAKDLSDIFSRISSAADLLRQFETQKFENWRGYSSNSLIKIIQWFPLFH